MLIFSTNWNELLSIVISFCMVAIWHFFLLRIVNLSVCPLDLDLSLVDGG